MLILFRAFDELSEVLFLCKNLSMKNILSTIINPYISISEKDILWEIMRLEEQDVSTNADLRKLSTNATAIPGQIGTITEPISASS